MQVSEAQSVVYVVSDAAGDTGEAVVKAAASQFKPASIEVRRVSFVHKKSDIDRVVDRAKETGGFIVFTLVLPELRDYLVDQARERRVICIDLLGPVLENLEKMIGIQSHRKPGMIHQLNEDYFRKVEAVEFAVRYDDGRDSSGILKADIVLVGVSRTSKTPLSMYLAHKMYKVANVPIVPELNPPKELFSIPKDKIIGLCIEPETLTRIRRERLRSLGLASNATYANDERIRLELEYSAKIMERLGCFVIDVSNKAVEETAGIILDRLNSLDPL